MKAFPEVSAVLAVPLYLVVAYFGLALARMGGYKAQKCLDRLDWRFFYGRIHRTCFTKERASVFFAIVTAAETLRFVGFVSCVIWISRWPLLPRLPTMQALVPVVALITFSLIGDFLPRYWAMKSPNRELKFSGIVTSCALTLLLPLQWALIRAFGHLGNRDSKSPNWSEVRMKERMLDILHDTDQAPNTDLADRKILRGVLNYQERIAKEIMVPRVRVFCLPAQITIREAASKILHSGYARIPVYREHIDHILGLLMARDVFRAVAHALFHPEEDGLERPIETLLKPALFAPESKPAAQLMQEFRKKKVHMAIVVDEYGGTEGIVTIEDILEEIVGDIRDEYDEGPIVAAQPDGSYLLDARTSILDVEEHLGIKVPQHTDYDSLSGYAFHKAGKIPEPGFSIHHDDFDLEVVSSSERRVEKVRITPTAKFAMPPKS